MLFNSHAFIFAFLPAALAVFFIVGSRDRRLAAAWLVLASLAFYGWWNPRFVLLVLSSAIANHLMGRALLSRPGARTARLVLLAAVTLNLGVLAFFKYANFFIATVDGATGAAWPPLDIVLPLGISFFTFTQIAFLVDAYAGRARDYGLLHYLLFVTWFPHLIAGPILRHDQLLPQLDDPAIYRPCLRSIAAGLTLFALGLGKKVLLADPLGELADPVFAAAREGARPQLLAAWGGALAYALQIYFDFSGYCDMAIGASLMFNIRLPLNFDSPYKAASIVEFWRRWHMTLSQFLRDYLYIPLGGNRLGPQRRYANVMVTMLLGGLWHGASWTFVAWGAFHGVCLVTNQAWHRAGLAMPRAAGAAITFFLVVVAWVLFRAPDFATALAMWSGMFGANGISVEAMGRRLPTLIALGLAVAWLAPNSQTVARYKVERAGVVALPSPAVGAAAGALFAVAVMGIGGVSAFLYYQF